MADRISTEEKLKRTQEKMRAGATERELVKEIFSGNKKYYLSFLAKYRENFSEFPQYFLGQMETAEKKSDKKKQNVPRAIKRVKNDVVDFSSYKIESMNKEELKKLNPDELGRLLIMFAPELLESLTKTQHLDKINKFIDEKNNLAKLDDMLIVPEFILKPKDLISRNFKFSSEVMEKFGRVAEKYGQYTKQTLVNLALLEFAEKYNKN